MNRSKRYQEIADEIYTEYTSNTYPEWGKKIASKWRNRVGLPRLVAEAALFEALGLVRSISANLFRNDPEMAGRFFAAVSALDEMAGEFARQNWRRFDGEEK